MKSLLLSEQAVNTNGLFPTQSIGSSPEESLKDLARIAAHIGGTPIALISVIENNHLWFKAQVGLNVTDIARVLEFCSVALPRDEAMVVPDLKSDQRFSSSSVVTSEPCIRFYASFPLITSQRQVLGALCLIDYLPRQLSQEQITMLLVLKRQVINQLEQQQIFSIFTQTIYEQQQTQQKLQESQIRLRLLNSISTKITAGMSVEQVIKHTIKQISKHFKSLRVVYSTIDEQKITVLYSLQPPGMPRLEKIIPIPALAQYFNSLHSYQAVVTEDVTKATWLKPFVAQLLSFGIEAMINIPLHHSDKLVGLICCDSPEPRQWSEHEISTFTEIAKYLSFALQEAHAQQKRSQAEAALREQYQRELLLSKITQQIRSSLELGEILQTTVTEARCFFQAERVVIYRCESDGDCVTITQSPKSLQLSALDTKLGNFWLEEGTNLYLQNHTYVINDIDEVEALPATSLPIELRKFLHQQQVKAGLIIPILQDNQLLGILAIYQYSQPRSWKLEEINLLEQLATQVAIAIQQGQLYQQVQQLNRNLEQKVQNRTAQLQQALEFEEALKGITDQVRDSLNENQILQTAVGQLALALGVDYCQALIYAMEAGDSKICYEYSTSSTSQAQLELTTKFSEVDYQLRQQEYFQSCLLTSEQMPRRIAILVCSIVDEQGVLGELRLIAPSHYRFNELEIRFVRQVANQCAIALRQARLYQAAQQQAEKLEKLNHLKDDFLSTVSHELRSPLTNIKMALKMLEMSFNQVDLGDAEPKINRYFQILQYESQRELNLINNLLDLSRLEAGNEPLEVNSINLNGWLPKIIEPFMTRTREQQQQLEVKLPAQLPPLNSDSTLLERILGELINNACKYTPAGEKITVSAQVTKAQVELQVSNSGVEIAAKELSQIFEKFYRITKHDPWKHGGTGLGLALVKKLVEHLEGTIKAESSKDQTIFTVQLPLTPNC